MLRDIESHPLLYRVADRVHYVEMFIALHLAFGLAYVYWFLAGYRGLTALSIAGRSTRLP